jgi:hypothetical protein
LALVAGAGIGATMMYLFDPDRGQARRQRAGECARNALDTTAAAAGAAWDTVAETTANLAHSAADSDIAHRVGDAARGMAAGAMGKLSDLGSNFGESAVATKRDWVNRASLAIGRDRDRHYVSQTACALGAMALGAGLVWMFDPRLGRSRRAWLRDKSVRLCNETGDFFRRSGRTIADHMRGTAAGTRSMLTRRQEPVSDEKLSARVRSELGRIVPNMHGITVTARDGLITLGGSTDPDRIDAIVRCAVGVPGVRSVENQLGGGQKRNPNGPFASESATQTAMSTGM